MFRDTANDINYTNNMKDFCHDEEYACTCGETLHTCGFCLCACECETVEIKKGDKIHVTFAWTENEQPSDKNFFSGKVLNVIRRAENIVYFEIEGLQNLVPADRAMLAS